MYKRIRIIVVALWPALSCVGCDTASEKSPRANFDRSVWRGSDIRVYYPQLDEPQRVDPQRNEKLVKAIGPLKYLKETGRFCIGPVGIAAETPPGEIALRMLMAEDDSPTLLKKLFDEGSIVGKLYALTGLYYKDRPMFNELASGFREDSRDVPMASGCIFFTQTVKEIIKLIESGNFDKDVQRAAR